MSNFKLIAIKTGRKLLDEELLSTDPTQWVPKEQYNYLKNLQPYTAFHFFNDYAISEDSKTLTHHVEKSIPNLYKLKNNIDTNIEVSAVVGKNGSGKSSLIEILYLAIHNLAVQLGILFDGDKNQVTESQNYLDCELFFLVNEETSYKLDFKYDEDYRWSNDCNLYKATKKGNTFTYDDFSDDFTKEDLKHLFYSISVNYSIYGLNSLEIGSWINHLFHKNDSYQTPLVINPMRTEGNFDINRENYLFKYRLLSNSVIKYKNKKANVDVIKGTTLSNLLFKLDSSKIETLEAQYVYHEDGKRHPEKQRSIEKLLVDSALGYNLETIANFAIKHILGIEFEREIVEIEYKEQTELYIVKKLYRIAFNYRKYWGYLGSDKPKRFKATFDSTMFIDYLKALKNDNTHITLKLRQALNYLVNNPLRTLIVNDKTITWATTPTGKTYEIPFNTFAKTLLKYSDTIINCLPPSLFKINIHVRNHSEEHPFDISRLSSGELQLIQSVQSSIYHLNNLESYQDTSDTKGANYQNVLMLFDEIELYFHPEYQRRIVNHLITEIDQLKLDLIRNIHVMYITHSPFVLSDIPHINQLNLKKGSPEIVKSETFAANIYELLQNTFYLESPIGAHAEEMVNEVLDKLNAMLEVKDYTDNEAKLEKLKGEFVEKRYLSIIRLIGDSLVRNKLLSMYFSCFGDDTTARKDFLEDQMRKIQSELKDLDND